MTLPPCLATLPAIAQRTLDLVDDLDQCFRVGFANLEPSHQSTLQALQRIFQGTPLQQCEQAITAFQQYEFSEPHFAAIASLRAALQGALFDQLHQQIQDELGRSGAVLPELQDGQSPINAPDNTPGHLQPLLESTRQWLMELALTGFTRMDAATLMPFTTTLEKLQVEPSLIRQSALLTGFFNELVSQLPTLNADNLPLHRWVDLWTRAMIGAQSLLPLPVAQPQSGLLELLGLDLQQHANLVSLVFYGLWTVEGSSTLARLTLSAYKVDAIQMPEIWLLFPQAAILLEALSQSKALQLQEVQRLPTGDLLLNLDRLAESATIAHKYDLMKRAAEYFAVGAAGVPTCGIQPGDRHPVQLAEPIWLKGYRVQGSDAPADTPGHSQRSTLHWSDTESLPIALERLSRLSELTGEAIANSSELFGLLRFDAGRWAVQPLAVTVGKKTIVTGQTAVKVLKSPPKTSTVGILQERAGRLLRQK